MRRRRRRRRRSRSGSVRRSGGGVRRRRGGRGRTKAFLADAADAAALPASTSAPTATAAAAAAAVQPRVALPAVDLKLAHPARVQLVLRDLDRVQRGDLRELDHHPLARRGTAVVPQERVAVVVEQGCRLPRVRVGRNDLGAIFGSGEVLPFRGGRWGRSAAGGRRRRRRRRDDGRRWEGSRELGGWRGRLEGRRRRRRRCPREHRRLCHALRGVCGCCCCCDLRGRRRGNDSRRRHDASCGAACHAVGAGELVGLGKGEHGKRTDGDGGDGDGDDEERQTERPPSPPAAPPDPPDALLLGH